MDTTDIVTWINDRLDYRRPGWTVTACVAPCPHVDINAPWVLVTVYYVEPDTNPTADGTFAQNRMSLLDPATVADVDALRAWMTGTLLWSVIHEERELIRERLDGAPDPVAAYHPHNLDTRARWAGVRDHVLAMVE